MPTALSLIAIAVAAAALLLTLRSGRSRRETGSADIPADVRALRQEVAGLRLDVDRALRHLSVVRYDAFSDVGGRLSWSAAILDDEGSGVVLSSIHGRNDQRSYCKGVRDWTSEQQLSPEEEAAIKGARPK